MAPDRLRNSLDSFLRETIAFYKMLLTFVLNGVRTYWWLSITPIVLFLGLVTWKYKKTEPYYSAKSSYTFHYLHKKVFGDMFYDVEQLVSKRSFKEVSGILKIPLKTAENILVLRATNIIDRPLHEDLTNMVVPFYIHVELRDKRDIGIIQGAVSRFLRSNSFAKEELKKDRGGFQTRITEISEELNVLDSLINNEALEVDGQKLKEWMDLSEQKSEERYDLREMLRTKEAISMLKPFEPVRVTKQDILAPFIFKYFVLALFLAIVAPTIMFWYNNPRS